MRAVTMRSDLDEVGERGRGKEGVRQHVVVIGRRKGA